MAHILAILVGLSGFILYMAAFFFPEVHRKNDFIWSGIIFFYALALWVYSGRITGGVLLGQVASVVVLGWLGWQTLVMRRQLTPYDQQTWVSGSGKSLGDVLFLNATQLGSQFKQRWEQLPLPAPLKGLPDQVGRTVGNLQTKPQPKMAPQAPTKTVEGTQAEPRKVRKKPKTTPATPAEATESGTSPMVEPDKTVDPQTEGAPQAETAIAPPSIPAPTPASQVEGAIAPSDPASSTTESEPDAIAPSPHPAPSEPTNAPEQPTIPAKDRLNPASVTASLSASSTPSVEADAASAAPTPVTDPAAPESVPLSAEAPTPEPQPEPEPAAAIPFTPPPGTEPTAVAHISEVTPVPSEGTPESATPMETVPTEDKVLPSTELSYVANTETMVPSLEPATDIPDTNIAAESVTPLSTESVEPASPVDVTSEPSSSDVDVTSEPTSSGNVDVAPTDQAADLPEVEPEPEPLMPSPIPPLPSENEAKTEWTAMTQDLWGRTKSAEDATTTDEGWDEALKDDEGDRSSADVPLSTPTAANGLDLSVPNVSESLQDEDWGEEDTEEPLSNGPMEDWDMDWNEPPEEPTPIQPPPVQPIIEPEELTFADMVAAANRTLTPEDRIVVDVKAVAITDDESTPPADNWDDWDEEDNDSWFDR